MKSEMKKYLTLGIILAGVLAVSIIIYFCIGKYSTFISCISGMIHIISPFVYGGALAYVLSPLCNKMEKKIYKFVCKHSSHKENAKALSEKLSIIFAYAILIFIIYAFLKLVLPQVIDSLKSIISVIPEWINELYNLYGKIAETNPDLGASLNDYANKAYMEANDFIESGIFKNAAQIVSVFSLRVFELGRGILNIVVAFIVSIYVLNGRKIFKAQLKKFIYAVFKNEWAEIVIAELRFADTSFGGFILGKLIDSFIIGIIAAVVLNIMDMPYSVLLAVIIGVTNIIPFFGPIIGAVPGVILILFISPLKALYFLIFVFILQQFDGNILGPKILGDKVGIPSIWVLFSILVFGSIWGVFGMIVGVPLFAVIIDIFTKFVNMRLKSKGMSCDTKDYYSHEK